MTAKYIFQGQQLQSQDVDSSPLNPIFQATYIKQVLQSGNSLLRSYPGDLELQSDIGFNQ